LSPVRPVGRRDVEKAVERITQEQKAARLLQ